MTRSEGVSGICDRRRGSLSYSDFITWLFFAFLGWTSDSCLDSGLSSVSPAVVGSAAAASAGTGVGTFSAGVSDCREGWVLMLAGVCFLVRDVGSVFGVAIGVELLR